jgi:rhodanese-related sulfurtransferase
VDAWAAARRTPRRIPEISPDELDMRMRRGDVAIIGVRGAAEWEAGRLPEVPNIPLGYRTERLDEIPDERPRVVHSQAGGRTTAFRTQAAAKMAVFESLEGWYDPHRRHSALGYLSPLEHDEQHARTGEAAAWFRGDKPSTEAGRLPPALAAACTHLPLVPLTAAAPRSLSRSHPA